jgi:DsbC/DsbD-like thiol-disulfide interchange protein
MRGCVPLWSVVGGAGGLLLSSHGRRMATARARAGSPKHLTVAAHVGAVVVSPGATVSLLADITPNPGIHVYAPGSKGYVPIALTIATKKDITPGKIVYPQSETLFFAPLSETVLVYQKPFRLTRPVTLAKSVKPGTTVIITGSVDYQACDDKICLFPSRSSQLTKV